MRGTRRFWLAVAATASLGLGSAVLDAPLLTLGAAGLAEWLLATQLAFVRAVSEVERTLTVKQSFDRTRVRTGVETDYTLTVSIDAVGEHLPLSVEATVPIAAQVASETPPMVALDQSTRSSTVTVPVTWRTVGEHTVPPATVTVRDSSGLFAQSFPTEPGPTVAVESPSLGPVHVGQSGKQLLRGVGEHEARGRMGGLSVEEIRKYVPGDALKYVDWKATARLNEAHVRNYEAESNRDVVLVVDHRHTMGDGPPGETKLAHLKAVATAFQERAEAIQDPLGYLTVDETGVTGSMAPVARADAYESCRHRITDLTPSSKRPAAASEPIVQTDAITGALRPSASTQSPIERTLLTYRDATGPRRHLPDQPLYNGLQSAHRGIRQADLLVICTDDSNPSELRNTVGVASRNATEVVVFITPSVAFESALLANLDDAYSRYQAFDSFRRELSRIRGVTAYEVGSPDQIAALLAGSEQTEQGGHA